MRVWVSRILLLLSFNLGCWSLLYAADEKAKAATAADVRVIIDVSGSMKKNDPDNLRVPATKLIANLLPKDSVAGIYLFGTTTKELLKPSTVGPNWYKQANKHIKKIHSRSAFTDIGQALERAMASWPNTAKNNDRIIILLTDGFVDISENKWVNQAAREKILKQVIPSLKAKNIRVYTIALSEQADDKLLQELSFLTDGIFARADDAENLSRTFFKVFESAVKRDALPLQGPEFVVDKNASEITLMIFRNKKKSGILKLNSPSGQTITRQQKGNNIKWHAEKNYDLITITSPEAGKWQVLSNNIKDPDNRIYVVSDLKMQSNDIPRNMFVNETHLLESRLTDAGKPVTKPELLDKVNIQVNDHPLTLDADHVFRRYLAHHPHNLGVQEVLIKANSPTFSREQRHRIVVYENPVQIKKDIDKKRNAYHLTMTPHADLVQSDSLQVQAWLKKLNGEIVKKQQFHFQDKPNWEQFYLVPKQSKILQFVISGKMTNGRHFRVVTRPYVLEAKAGQPIIKPRTVAIRIKQPIPVNINWQQPKVKKVVPKKIIKPKPVTKPKIKKPAPKPIIKEQVKPLIPYILASSIWLLIMLSLIIARWCNKAQLKQLKKRI